MDFKAKDLLDFKPTLFEEALKTTIEWYDKEFVSQYDYRHSFSKCSSRICGVHNYVMINRLVQQALNPLAKPACAASPDTQHCSSNLQFITLS